MLYNNIYLWLFLDWYYNYIIKVDVSSTNSIAIAKDDMRHIMNGIRYISNLQIWVVQKINSQASLNF